MRTSVKIDFLVPGFSKCGTTTLCQMLSTHPDIYIPPAKELWYFSSENYETQGPQYDKHFADAAVGQLKGEGSVSYSGAEYEHISVQRIFDNNPDCRFIFIARNPRHRVESSYRQMHHSGVQYGINAPFTLGECMKAFPQMVDDSLYWQRTAAYRRRFGDKSILVVFLEDLRENARACLDRCFRHLEVEPKFCPEPGDIHLNQGRSKYRDTRLLRLLRRWRVTGLPLAKMGTQEEQDGILVPLRLRRLFGRRPVVWDELALDILRCDIDPDASKFLTYYGKDPAFWGLNEEG